MSTHTIPHGLMAYNADPRAYTRNSARLRHAMVYIANKERVRAVNNQIKYAHTVRSARLKGLEHIAPVKLTDGERVKRAMRNHERKSDMRESTPLAREECTNAVNDILTYWQANV